MLVEDVRRSTPAWESGLRPGDVIVAVGRDPVRDLAELREAFPIDADDELAFEIRRRGRAYLAVIE